jgi:hypothetical protein
LDLLRDMTQMRTELMESEKIRDRMSAILRQVADALHGGPLEDGYWSWHDLPELAAALRTDATTLKDKLRNSENSREALASYIRTMPDPVQAKAGTAYAEMVETCHKIGLAPLTPEQFAKEDARLLVEWNERRHGLDPLGPSESITRGPKISLGTYGQFGGAWPHKQDLFFKKLSLWRRLKRRLGIKEWWK